MVKITKAGGLHRNAVSYFGGLVVIISVLLILFFLLLNFSLKQPGPYFGIFIYLIFPGFLTLGILIFLYGLRRESFRRRRLATKEALAYPRLDLNDPHQRKKFTFALAGGSVLLMLLAWVGYNAYFFTDSVTFCGKICHTVMKPEYTAYLNSPHARVECVDCHVGSGVSWYVKSKISGIPEVYAVLFNTYSTPIRVPIKHLRPARETCNQCHWPEKFYGAQLIQIPYFRYDEKNTGEHISLLVKTGGGGAELSARQGIHWHMIIQNQVSFKATDTKLQDIPWIKMVHSDGSVKIYKNKNANISDEELEKLPSHSMDCMDCHNRPTHIFSPPETAVNISMENGNIPRGLPWIKKVALDALVKNYQDTESAHQGIRRSIKGYYEEKFPDDLKNLEPEIDQAIGAVLAIYDRNVFPDMKVSWATYPNNIGHRYWPGCSRCHDGLHVDQSGEVLTDSCTICHTMPQRGPLVALGAAIPYSTEPWHPWPLEGAHTRTPCHLCHRAGFPPPLSCAACHEMDASSPMMSMDCNTCHLKEQEVQPIVDCHSCHSDIGGTHSPHSSIDCTDCHLPHTWIINKRDTCLTCHDDKKTHHAPTFCGECHQFT